MTHRGPDRASVSDSGIGEPDREQITRDLRELVTLRNALVHHFLAAHDLGSVDGCSVALATLRDNRAVIERHWERLKVWPGICKSCTRRREKPPCRSGRFALRSSTRPRRPGPQTKPARRPESRSCGGRLSSARVPRKPLCLAVLREGRKTARACAPRGDI